MSVRYILERAGQKMGLNPSDVNQRPLLLGYLNEAANELYTQCDMAGCLVEQCFKINGNQTISLPSYVGTLRAVREVNSQINWHINKLRPRYNESNWDDAWRNFRLKGKQPLEAAIVNSAPLEIVTSLVETPNVVVIITGRTDIAESVTETITLDALTKLTVNNFTDITGINKDRVNTCNILVKDADGVILATINNNELTSCYQVVDISQCPWNSSSSTKNEHYVEVLYKKKLGQLFNDGDEFPAQGYDDVLVNKMLQLYYEENRDIQTAAAYDAKATRTLTRIHNNENVATEDVVSFVSHPHDRLLAKNRTGKFSYNFRH